MSNLKYNRMKKLFTFLTVALLGVSLGSCQYDDDDLWKEIDGIKTELAALNKDVSSLQTLVDALQKSKTITEVKQTADGYTIVFNDGTSVSVANGKNGQNAPEVGIDLFEGAYYWTIGGKGNWLTDAGGNKIPVAGEEGRTPGMAVDAEGYWTVDGKRITDASGSEVKAAGKDGDAFFDSVEEGDSDVTFTLTDGTTFVIPKTSSTAFGFVTPAEGYSCFTFAFGEEKALALNVTDVATADFMNIPQGWTATLDLTQKRVTVTAPAASGTTYTEGIISLVGIDKNGKTLLASAGVCAVDFSDPNGAFVLNEGNMTSEPGSVIYITPAGKVIDRAYRRMNNSTLGNSTQDICIADNKMYIIAQNGNRDGGDGMLVVADARTLKREAAYNDELSKLSWPTHIAVVGKSAYIRDNAGVYRFDLDTKALALVDGTGGALKNRMAVVGDKVFVPASKSVLVLQNGAVVQKIAFPGAVSGVIKSDDGNLWVSCTTSPAQISKVSAADYSIIRTNTLGDKGVGAGWGATPGISARGDAIYFSNATSKICRHTFSTDQTEYLTDVKDHIGNVGMAYNNLAVHPVTGEVYFNSIKGYGPDFLTNDITVFDFSAATPVLIHDYKDYTRFPAGIFFTAGF